MGYIATYGYEFLLFVILVIWKYLIYYLLHKTPNKNMYVCMIRYKPVCATVKGMVFKQFTLE